MADQTELAAMIRQGRGSLTKGAVELGGGALGDEADRPVLTLEVEIASELVGHRAQLLVQIARALKKLEEGSYWRCETCETPIPRARLKALPFATRCARCQEIWEREHAQTPAPGS